ncbi:MAG: N-6 DNA methylase [Niabella sp.]
MREEDIERIVQTYQFREERSRYSRRISMDEIEKNGYNLNISRYVSTAIEEEKVDLKKVNEELTEINKKIKEATDRHNEFLRELGVPLI